MNDKEVERLEMLDGPTTTKQKEQMVKVRYIYDGREFIPITNEVWFENKYGLENSAYQVYCAALIAVPYDEMKRYRLFAEWQRQWRQLERCDRALLLVERMAERYPPEAFECESGFGDLDCALCGTTHYGHASDCIAVLVQEFRV